MHIFKYTYLVPLLWTMAFEVVLVWSWSHVRDTVIETESGTKAVDAAKNHNGPLDLLITDIMLPGLCGNEVAESLIEKYPHMSVLFVSGTISDHIVNNHEKLRVVDFLQKPFGPTALLKCVHNVLENKRAMV